MEIFVKFACFVMVAVGCGNVHSFLLLDITYFIFNWKKKKTKIKSYSPYIEKTNTSVLLVSIDKSDNETRIKFYTIKSIYFFLYLTSAQKMIKIWYACLKSEWIQKHYSKYNKNWYSSSISFQKLGL